MKLNLNKLSYWIWPVLWAGVIFYMSSFPAGPASTVHWQDFIVKKMAHVTEYAILTILVYRAFINNGLARSRALKYAILISVFYGVTDEFHQSFTPGREPTLRDVIIDTLGVLLSSFFIWKLLPKAPTRLRKLAASFQIN